MFRHIGLLACFLFLIVGCAKIEENVYRNGTDARVNVKAQRGVCEDINTYDSGTYWSETWWYWAQGISYSFKKSERIEEQKEKDGFLGLGEKVTKIHYTDIVISSTYTFDPITAPRKSTNRTQSEINLPQDYQYIEPVKYW